MEDYLVVTDLDSTNGTFIGEKRLVPGVAAAALPGSLVTFGKSFHRPAFLFLTFYQLRVSTSSYVEPKS